MNFPTRKATDFIVVHCSATPEGKSFNAKDIDRMHRQRGFQAIGYHYVVLLNGTIESGRPDNTIGAHVLGYNSTSVGVCYIGGLDAKGQPKDTRTPEQKVSLLTLVKSLRLKYPGATIFGHRDFSPDEDGNGRTDPYEWIKQCPCFDAIPEYRDL